MTPFICLEIPMSGHYNITTTPNCNLLPALKISHWGHICSYDCDPTSNAEIAQVIILMVFMVENNICCPIFSFSFFFMGYANIFFDFAFVMKTLLTYQFVRHIETIHHTVSHTMAGYISYHIFLMLPWTLPIKGSKSLLYYFQRYIWGKR